MLRAVQMFSFCFVLVALTATADSAFLDNGSYEMGPFHVEGVGIDPADAEDEAYGEMWDMLVDIEANLPYEHFIMQVIVENEGLISSNEYEIDFHVVIGHPMQGGGQGGGRGL